jgi:uncharacterized protein (TIGR03905 family)
VTRFTGNDIKTGIPLPQSIAGIRIEKIIFTSEGVCSSRIFFTLDAGKVVRVEFMDGCEGNLQGIASLVEEMEVAKVIKRLRGIDFSGRGTFCPDQLAKTLKEAHD